MASTQKPQTIDFLGRGIAMPYTVTNKAVDGRTAIVESVFYAIQVLDLIFDTRKYSRPMRRRLGFNSNSVVLKPILSSLRSQVEYYANDALKSFNETRFTISRVDVDWKKSKGSDIYFVVTAKDVSTGENFQVSFLWEYIR